MCSSRKLILLLVLASFSVIVLPLVAQDLDNVTIAGRVTDQHGAVIPGATITATLVKARVERTVVTDGDGRYKLAQLEPGVYKINASFTNFAAEAKADLATVA